MTREIISFSAAIKVEAWGTTASLVLRQHHWATESLTKFS